MMRMADSVLAIIITNQSELIRGMFCKNQQRMRGAAMLSLRNFIV